jgi:hypothetical protein
VGRRRRQDLYQQHLEEMAQTSLVGESGPSE